MPQKTDASNQAEKQDQPKSPPAAQADEGRPNLPENGNRPKPPDPGSRQYSWYLLKRCLKYFAPYKLRILIAMLGMAAAAASEAATAYLVKPVMDDIFLSQDPGNRTMLYLVPLAFVVVTLCKGGGRLVQNYMMQSCGLKVLERLRDELYNKIIKLPLRFYETTQIGMLMSRIINDVGTVRTSLPSAIMIVRQFLTMGALVGVAYYQNWKLAIVGTLVLPLAMFPFVHFGRRLRKLGRKGQAILSEATVILQEILSGIRVVKAFSMEASEGQHFDKANKGILKVALRRTLTTESSSAVMEMIGALGIGTVLFYGGMQVLDGEATAGTFFSFVTALALLYEPMKKLTIAYNDIQSALAGAERVFAMLDSTEIVEESGGDKVMEHSFTSLEFDNVSFSYDGQRDALSNLNLTVRSGERLALVGPSGGGKTTFVNLLPRFYDPTSGVIRMDGQDLREFTLPSLRAGISIVSQDNFLFNCSIRDNIAYGQAEFTDEQVVAAAKSAYAHDFIMDMPEGYNTIIGERGVKLSGGQKQRLTIARAIAKDAPLLILDEATSALDSESEKIVQKALENLMQGRTSIVIAHRLSTVLNSDRILVIEAGKVAAAGTHRELLETSPLYAKLYQMQFSEDA
ncbi:MAG: ABC transporter ATP-binding protein/permease [Deltaproteobacteria bacterium]|jgi:subfamily B ATP-binding cassette protein MsbA|nr:ABC transporter ATP-binding protein/permease [Deltaproteobacteria bacterium]